MFITYTLETVKYDLESQISGHAHPFSNFLKKKLV